MNRSRAIFLRVSPQELATIAAAAAPERRPATFVREVALSVARTLIAGKPPLHGPTAPEVAVRESRGAP